MHFDVFNGDADGIIALIQLRLAEPKNATLITGVKRDISLLQQVDVNTAASVTVLDISLEKNIEALTALLANNVDVFYVDHHRTGDIPLSKQLTTLINTDANICTSLLVNQFLEHKYVNWAIAAAFGDNMKASAIALAEQHGLNDIEQQKLSDLGTYINYNGYGRNVEDLHFSPDSLFKTLLAYSDPLKLIEQSHYQTDAIFNQLEQAYNKDMAKAQSATIVIDNDICKVVELADEAWARRVSGVFGNELANKSPDKAHAVVTLNQDNSYTISLRAPLNNKQGADVICSQFPTGGGRSAAAGVNQLPKEMLGDFITIMTQYYA